MKIGVITTLNTNIGDDFIREGIFRILKRVYSERDLEFVIINKHDPYSIYQSVSLVPTIRKIPGINLYGRTLKRKLEKYYSLIGNKFRDCDLIIQSGAPVVWPNCYANEWALPIWDNTIGRLYEKIPVWNLAAGSCFPWEAMPEKIEGKDDFNYISRINSYSSITTFRDSLAKNLFEQTGLTSRHALNQCTAFQFTGHFQEKSNNTILINYMEGGGHFDWNQNIDKNRWKKTIEEIYKYLVKDYKVVFLCHNQKEVDEAYSIDSNCQTILPNNLSDYIQNTKNVKAAICNRMHASVALASIGIPSIAIGTDSRLLMVKELGLPTFYVKDANIEVLIESFEKLLRDYLSIKDNLWKLKNESFDRYLQLLG